MVMMWWQFLDYIYVVILTHVSEMFVFLVDGGQSLEMVQVSWLLMLEKVKCKVFESILSIWWFCFRYGLNDLIYWVCLAIDRKYIITLLCFFLIFSILNANWLMKKAKIVERS